VRARRKPSLPALFGAPPLPRAPRATRNAPTTPHARVLPRLRASAQPPAPAPPACPHPRFLAPAGYVLCKADAIVHPTSTADVAEAIKTYSAKAASLGKNLKVRMSRK
jgi:hypothetical protein